MKRVGLFIGINQYEDKEITPLSWAVKDAQEMAYFFKHQLSFDQTEIVAEQDYLAGKTPMRLIRQLGSNLQPGDQFVLFFAGHGYTVIEESSTPNTSDTVLDQLCLLPDASPRALANGNTTGEGLLSYKRLRDDTDHWQGVQRIFIFDACRTPLSVKEAQGRSAENAAVSHAKTVFRDLKLVARKSSVTAPLVILNSCADLQKSAELAEAGHGLFTAGLIETLGQYISKQQTIEFRQGLEGEIACAMQEQERKHGRATSQQTPCVIPKTEDIIRIETRKQGAVLPPNNLQQLQDDFETQLAAGQLERPIGECCRDTLAQLTSLQCDPQVRREYANRLQIALDEQSAERERIKTEEERKARLQRDERRIESARLLDTPEAYANYLSICEECEHAVEAREAIAAKARPVPEEKSPVPEIKPPAEIKPIEEPPEQAGAAQKNETLSGNLGGLNHGKADRKPGIPSAVKVAGGIALAVGAMVFWVLNKTPETPVVPPNPTPAPTLAPTIGLQIAPQFDDACDFVEGLACVRIGDDKTGKWGYIDQKGKMVVNPAFDSVENFSEGLARVCIRGEKIGKCGFIDKNGNVAINLNFDYAEGFSEGLAAVRLGDYVKKGDFSKDELEWGFDIENGKYGFIDKQGRLIIGPQYEFHSWGYRFKEGLALFKIGGVDNGRFGYINRQGKEVIKPIFVEADHFENGIAVVQVGDKKTGKFGVIDKEGNFVINPRFDYAQNVAGLLSVREGTWKNGKYGVVDKQGNVLVKLQFEDGVYFYAGLAVVKINGKYGYINQQGDVAIEPQFDQAEGFSSDGLAAVRIGGPLTGKWGFIDKHGKLIFNPQFDDRDGSPGVGHFSEGFAKVRIDGKWGYVAAVQLKVEPNR